MSKPFAIYDESPHSPWVSICDTSISHVNGVGIPIARVVRGMAGIVLDALQTFTERRQASRVSKLYDRGFLS